MESTKLIGKIKHIYSHQSASTQAITFIVLDQLLIIEYTRK
jgi:hypothetical protein